jgi:hypothetical protein
MIPTENSRVAILIQPDADWPVIVATDTVPGASVGRHWPDYPEVTGLAVGGVPLLAVNRQGVFAAVVPIGEKAGKRDPHELVLDLLDNPDAADAAQALRDLDPLAYGLFTLVVGDNRDCYVAGNWQEGRMQVDTLGPGCTTLGPGDWILPEGLQPVGTDWKISDRTMMALPGITLFGTAVLWKASL